jgi:hypothetical protein
MAKRWQDWVNLVLGLWILLSPWALQFATAEHAWNAYVVGAGIAILAAAALIVFQPWEEWVNLALGAWLLASPWLLGFSTATIAMWNAVIIGALVVVFAGWALAQMQGQRQLAR